MIDKRELRIGNYFNNKFNLPIVVLAVREIREDAILGIDLENKFNGSFEEEWINPIRLTEDWLLKFGFDERDYTYSFGGFHIAKDFSFWQWLTTDESHGIELKNCPKYVHQLQNLFFALTGEELTIKENG